MDWNSIKITNPWWDNLEKIDDDPHLQAVKGKPFYYANPLKEELIVERSHIYIIRGARQVGKTTLMKEIIARELKQGTITPHNCMFLSCEAFKDYDELRELLATWLKDRNNHHILMCLDEITFVEEWQRALLWIINAGLLRNATVLISGSNARDLQEMSERFPGRNVKEIKIYPLSLNEYGTLTCFKNLTYNQQLDLYSLVGGFPHAIRNYYELGIVHDDTYETYANWIFGDAHRFGLNREILLHILYRVYETLTSRVTYQRLIEKSPVKSHETAQSYIEHVEYAFLCRVLSCYDPDKKMAAPRKAKKIYYIDPLLYQIAGGFLSGIRNTFLWWKKELENSIVKGNIFESIVVNQLARFHERIYFWYSSNTQKEVDIVIDETHTLKLYEVKKSSDYSKQILGKEVEVILPGNFHEFM